MVINSLNRQYVTGDRVIREREGLILWEPHSTLVGTAISNQRWVPGSIATRMWKIRSGSQLLWLITWSLGWRKGTHLCFLHALMPLLFRWRKNQYLTQRANLPAPWGSVSLMPARRRYILQAVAEKCNDCRWLVDFLCEGDYFCSRVRMKCLLFLFPSCHVPTFLLNRNPFPGDHLRTLSKSA